jgi:opacity protein-like surface antigen
MRAVILGLAGLVVAGNASAADFLRGSYDAPPPRYNWAGVYVGAQIGYENANSTFAPTTRNGFVDPLIRPTIQTELSNQSEWPLLPGADTRHTDFGGFVGYNTQWGDVVLGLELNYMHSGAHISGTFTPPLVANPNGGGPGDFGQVVYTGDVRLNDYGTLSARVGYAWGWLLPYVGAGVAMGNADVVRQATVSYNPDLGLPPSCTATYCGYTDRQTWNNQLTFGYSARVGVDIGLFPGVFVRGEYEFVQLKAIKGMEVQLNNFRVAAAVKF